MAAGCKENIVLANAVRKACVERAVAAYESARISGLCAEGAFEAAVSAIRMLQVEALVDSLADAADGSRRQAKDGRGQR